MASTVRLAANALFRRFVIRTQLNASVNLGIKGQLAERVSKQTFLIHLLDSSPIGEMFAELINFITLFADCVVHITKPKGSV